MLHFPEDPSPPRHGTEGSKKRSYRRHPKPDPNAPERPYSAYVLFSNHTRDQLKAQNLSFTNLSKQVGERWQAISADEKEAWTQRGAGPWEEYKRKVAEYQKTEQYQEYQEYLAEFKAAHPGDKTVKGQNAAQQSSTSLKTSDRYHSSTSGSSPKQHPSASSYASQTGSLQYGPKVAMKRMRRDEESSSGGQTTRSTRPVQTCEPCRLSKNECDGDQPICRQCRNNGVECRYQTTKAKTPKLYLQASFQEKIKANPIVEIPKVLSTQSKCMRHCSDTSFLNLKTMISMQYKTPFFWYLFSASRSQFNLFLLVIFSRQCQWSKQLPQPGITQRPCQ